MELPLLKSMWNKYNSQGLEIVVVDIQANTKGALEFITEHELPYLFLEDKVGEGNIHKNIYNAFAFPTSFIIDREGMIHYYHLGFEAGDEHKLEQEIVGLLQKNIAASTAN